jgi:gliding motility-associated-like protein
MKKLLFRIMPKSFTWLIVLSFFISLQSNATHIVGGEFQLKLKRGYNYELILRMYFDDINASQGLLNQDLTIIVAIYQKSNNQLMTPKGIELKQISNNFIGYKDPTCSSFNSATVRTRLLYYTSPDDIFLDPCIYNDPGGYYVVWERCCRNATIKNINNPDNTGNTFYLEFPPVADPGCTSRIINTSPLFNVITGEFPCLGQPFTFDFGAFDPDGDSLYYKLVIPTAGYSSQNCFNCVGAEPFPDPGPYPLVSMNSQYRATNPQNNEALNLIPGNPALYVDHATGLLHVTPNQLGLFAVSLEVYEYRNGVRIGMVRRDFQFLVINCPNLVPGPKVDLKKPGGGIYAKGDTINLHVEADTCFNVVITDTATKSPYNKSSALTIQTIKSNIPSNIFSINSSYNISPANDTIITPLCFDACKKLNIQNDSLFFIEIVVQDHQCPNPKVDTLRLNIVFKPQINASPKIKTLPSPAVSSVSYEIGSSIQFTVIGTDADQKDIITLSAEPQGFNLGDYGMSFSGVSGHDSITSPFSWQIPCQALQPGHYKILFRVQDNSCIINHKDSLFVEFSVVDKETTLGDINPPNLVTPNGDGHNDFYELVNLPPDNCTYYFKEIVIFNRWGSKVYESARRDFRWDARKFSDGLYYYLIDLNAKKIKGWVDVIK